MTLNLYQKIAALRAELDIRKNGRNDYAGYDYYRIEDLYASAKKVFAKYNIATYNDLTFLPEIGKYRATLHVVDADSPENRFSTSIDAGINVIKSRKTGEETLIECQKVGTNNTYMFKYLFEDLLMVDDGANDSDETVEANNMVEIHPMEDSELRVVYLNTKAALENCDTPEALADVWRATPKSVQRSLLELKDAMKECFKANGEAHA